MQFYKNTQKTEPNAAARGASAFLALINEVMYNLYQ